MNLQDPSNGDAPLPALAEAAHPSDSSAYAPAGYRPRVLLPVVLFFLTLGSTTISGAIYHYTFQQQVTGDTSGDLLTAGHLLGGFPYAVAVVGILLAHELGHYLACRYYGIAATLPYFIPFPLLNYFGTMGAMIRIRSPFGDRRQLFDVGVAGPLAGYVFAIPALIIGIQASQVVPFEAGAADYIYFGEPLIFKLVAHGFFDYSEATETLALHPIGWAAWFGIFATSINLFPAGQLDGGHLVYALFGRQWHRRISLAVCGLLAALSAATWSPAYLFFSLLVVLLGLRHPRTVTEELPLDGPRKKVALLAAFILAVSFIPVPVQFQ